VWPSSGWPICPMDKAGSNLNVLLLLLGWVAIYSPVGAWFLQLGTRWMAKQRPSYVRCYGTSLLSHLGSLVFAYVVVAFADSELNIQGSAFPVLSMVSMVLGIGIPTALISVLLKIKIAKAIQVYFVWATGGTLLAGVFATVWVFIHHLNRAAG